MKIQMQKKWSLLIALACLISLPSFADDQMQVNLMAGCRERVILPVGQAQQSGQWQVDPCDTLSLVFGAPSQSLLITITSPDGTDYVMEAPAQDGVNSFVFPDRTLPDLKGLNYIYRITNPAQGVWSWRIDDSQTRTKEVPVFVHMVSDSPVRAGLLGGGMDYVVGEEMTLATVILSGMDSLTDYAISATVRHASVGGDAALNFADDGGDGDEVAGDGVATARFTPSVPGAYWVKARITGTLADGTPYVRDVSTEFRAVADHGRLQGTFEDRGVDDDGNGLFDRIGINVPLSVDSDGEYLVRVTLSTASGKQLHAAQLATLTAGLPAVEVFFNGDDIRELGEDGPYLVSNVVLEFSDGNDALQIDRREDVGETAAYELSQFEREPIELLGVLDSYGTDFDNNGKFDRLTLTTGLDLTNSGYYRWSARLVDSNGTELGFAFGAGYLSGSTTVTMNFPGLPIGENGVDGPYRLRNFIIYGAGTSRIVNQVGLTEPFTASQFEGFVSDTEPPVLTLTAGPEEIWPPNHKMVEVAVSYEVTDNIDPDPVVRLESVLSSDGENGIGDGNTSPDIEITSDGRIYVRAERAGPKDDRVYTITFSATDAAGNSSEASAEIRVLHDQKNK